MQLGKASAHYSDRHSTAGDLSLPLGARTFDMNPGTFVTLLILSWLMLAGVTLWALLRVPMRRARLHRLHGEQEQQRATPSESLSATDASPQGVAARKRHFGKPLWSR